MLTVWYNIISIVLYSIAKHMSKDLKNASDVVRHDSKLLDMLKDAIQMLMW